MLSRTIRALTFVTRALALATLVWAAGQLPGTALAHADAPPIADLTPSELTKLAAGKLIARPVVSRHGDRKLMGGTSYQVIDAPMHVVWAALLDTPRYTRMMPEVVEARLVERKGNARTVFVRQGNLPLLQVAYYLNVKVNEQRHDIEFRLDESRPHDLQNAFGFYSLGHYEGGRTLLTYGIMADIGSGFFAAVTRDNVHEWMLKTPFMVKQFIEGSGRGIYRW